MYWNAGYQWHPGEKQNKAMHAKNQENKMVNVQTQITKFTPINKKKRSCKDYNASWRHLVANHY